MMKRPLFTVGLTFLIGTVVVVRLGLNAAVAVGLFCAISGVLLLRGQGWWNRLALVLLSIALACGGFAAAHMLRYEPAAALADQTLYFEGLVTEVTRSSGGYPRYYVTGHFPDLADAPDNMKLLLSSNEMLPVRASEQISCHVKLYRPYGTQALELYYRSRGIFLHGMIDGEAQITQPAQKGLAYYMVRGRQRMSELIRGTVHGQPGEFLVSITMGDRSRLDPEIASDMARSGLVHILSISGLHVSIFAAFLIKLFTMLGLSRKSGAAVSIPLLFGFVLLAGFAFSAVRAGIMVTVYTLSVILSRGRDALTSLAFAAMLILLWNPFAAYDAGFLMSVAGTLGIILYSDPIGEFILTKLSGTREAHTVSKLLSYFVMLFAVSLAAAAFTVPIAMLSYGYVALYAPFASIFALPLSQPVIVLGIFGTLIGLVPVLAPISGAMLLVAGLLSDMIIAIAHAFSALPFATLPVDDAYAYLWLGGLYAAWLLLRLLKAQAQHTRAVMGAFAAMLLVGVSSNLLFNAGTAQLISFPGANGVLLIKSGSAAIVGAPRSLYEGKQLLTALDAYSIQRVDAVIFTGEDADDALGLIPVLEQLRPRLVVAPKEGRYAPHIAALSKDAVRYDSADMTVRMLGGVRLDLLRQSGGYRADFQIGSARVLTFPGIAGGVVNASNYDIIYDTQMNPQLIGETSAALIKSARPERVDVLVR